MIVTLKYLPREIDHSHKKSYLDNRNGKVDDIVLGCNDLEGKVYYNRAGTYILNIEWKYPPLCLIHENIITDKVCNPHHSTQVWFMHKFT